MGGRARSSAPPAAGSAPGVNTTPRANLLAYDITTGNLITNPEAIVRRVLARVEGPWDPETELSDDPLAASWKLAAIAPLGEYDRHVLLRSTTVGALLRQIIDLTLEAELLWSAE